MYKHKRIIRLIDELCAYGALELVVWTWRENDGPRIWLKSWCGAKTNVSLGTAEWILHEIKAGRIRPPKKRKARPIAKQPRLPASAEVTV